MKDHTKWIEKAIEELAETGKRKNEYWRGTYSAEDDQGVKLLKGYMEERGMKTRFDAVGNLYGRIQGKTQDVIMTGSHRDTVRNGGKYDGALGVATSIETVGALFAELGQPEKTVEVVALCEEESSRFPTSYLGSRHIIGEFFEQELNDLDGGNIKLGDAMRQSGYLKEPITTRKREDLERFVELHIEQGGLLENQKKQIGIVTSIVGLLSGEVTFKGHQNHAGTTPMYMRKDPVPVMAEFIYQLNQWAMTHQEELVCTVGRVCVEPGNANVIPEQVMITFDIRSSKEELQQEARETIEKLKKQLEGKIEIQVFIPCDEPPIAVAEDGIEIMEEIAKEKQYKYMKMVSGAGHDSQVIAQKFKVNMIFVPSVDGISHSAKEFTKVEDIQAGAMMLTEFLKKIAWQK